MQNFFKIMLIVMGIVIWINKTLRNYEEMQELYIRDQWFWRPDVWHKDLRWKLCFFV